MPTVGTGMKTVKAHEYKVINSTSVRKATEMCPVN